MALEFEKQRAVAEERYKANEKTKMELDRNIRIQKEILFKST